MSRRKKVFFWITGAIGTLLVFLLALLLLLPRLINVELLREKIQANISKTAGASVNFQALELDFFPRPYGVMHQASLSIPKKAEGTLESLKVYPKILPLLIGKLRVAELQVNAPDFKIKVPEGVQNKSQGQKVFSWEVMKEKAASSLALATRKASGLVVIVENGRLGLLDRKESVFQFEDIHARIGLPLGKVRVDVTCASNLWDKISFHGRLDVDGFKADGEIDLSHFRPHVLPAHLFPPKAPRVRDSQVNLNLTFETEGFKVLEAKVQGSIPHLAFHNGNQRLVIRGKNLKGAFYIDADQTTVSLSELNLDDPQCNINGKLVWDWAVPKINLDLEGKNADVSSTRKAALALAGKVSAIRKLCDVLRGGRVPLITFSTYGSTWRNLGKVESITIKGNMLAGEITVPACDLNLKDVKGKVVIAKGTLEAKNLEGRLGKSRASKGTLKLGLEGLKEKNVPFHLDIGLEADLTQLPPILKRLVKNEPFVQQVNLVDNLKGNATGRLVLGDTLSSIKTRVHISKFDLVAKYRPMPYLLEIKQGQLFHDGNEIDLKNLTGKLGKSSFSEFSARLDLGKDPHLEAKSGKSSLVLDEIYPWLMSYERLSGKLKDLKSVTGTVASSTLSLKGPLLKPKRWKFQVAGAVKDLAVHTPLFPKPLRVTQGRFEAAPEKLSVTDAQTDALGTSLNLSGFVEGYQEGVHKTEATFSGTMQPEGTEWISDIIHLPRELYIRSPLSISQGRLTWKKGGGTSFSGNLAVANGPEISMDVIQDSEGLTVKDLLIQDEKSDASITFHLKKKEFGFRFSGNLRKSTMDQCLIQNQCLEGWIKGDFQTRISIDQPGRSVASGSVKAEKIILPWILKVPTRIENLSLDAKEDNLKVESAIVTLGDDRITLEGNVRPSVDGLLCDMDLFANEIEWENIRKILDQDGEDSQEREVTQAEDSWDLPVRGVLRLKSGSFAYNGFTWSPCHADISFDRNRIAVDVREANLCSSISFPGSLSFSPQEVQLDFKAGSKGQELDAILKCLANKKGLMVGKFDFDGKVTAKGKPEEVTKSLQGKLKFMADEGRIYRFGVLAKIFAVLNVTEIFRGGLPDLAKEGFSYHSITAKGSFENGRLIVSEAIVNSPSMDIFSEGDIDLIDKKLDITVVVAPLKTVDYIVNKIPLVNYLLGGALISIPIKVEGDWADPMVTPLSPTAVGSQLLGIIKRTVRLPIKIIEPLAPEGEQ